MTLTLAAFGSLLAQADVVNFDDLTGSGAVADGYHGITWQGNWTFYDSSQSPYNAASGATRVYAASGAGSIGEVTFLLPSGSSFAGAFFSGYGTSDNKSTISFNLYLGSTLVATSGSLDPNSTPTFLSSGYGGLVSKVGVIGTNDFYVMDDVTFSAARLSPTPEPSTYAFMATGLGALAFAHRRRKRT